MAGLQTGFVFCVGNKSFSGLKSFLVHAVAMIMVGMVIGLPNLNSQGIASLVGVALGLPTFVVGC